MGASQHPPRSPVWIQTGAAVNLLFTEAFPTAGVLATWGEGIQAAFSLDVRVWGNDYPHDEGTFPNSRPIIEAMRQSVEPGDMRRILGENAAKLYGFDLDYLADHRIVKVA